VESSPGSVAAAAPTTPHLDRKRRKDARRKRKTNRLLVAIAVVFAGSWLPLNVFNIIADFDHELVLALDRSGLIFAVRAPRRIVPDVTPS